MKMFKYCWVWDKGSAANFVLANKQPLKYHEDICVFSKKQHVYNPIKWQGKPNNSRGKSTRYNTRFLTGGGINATTDDLSGMKFPRSIIEIQKHASQSKNHPTEKPVELCEYLIKTYTNDGALILDNCIGSGTTALAAINTGRNYIGIEKEEEYYLKSLERIENVLKTF